MEDNLPLTKLAVTPCAHTFCTSCLQLTAKQMKSCSICRQPLSEKDVIPVSSEIALVGPAIQKPRNHRYRAYGTKLAVLVEKLQDLRVSDPTAKVTLFVQFEDLKQKVASALA